MTTSHNNLTLKDRLILVTGANGYLGSAISKELAREGAEVIAWDRAKADLCDRAAVIAALDKIEREHGPLDACVHCAWSKPEKKHLSRLSDSELMAYLDENIRASHNILSACAARFKERGKGVIIGITTARVAVPEATRIPGAYIPAKFALQGMLAVLQEELKPSNVRVYSIAPDVMEGGMNEDMPKAFMDMIRAQKPGKALTRPEDVAMLAARLCSDGASGETRLTFAL